MKMQNDVLKIVKITNMPDGGLLIDVEIIKENLYSFLKEKYNVKRGSKKLIERFVKEAIINFKRRKNNGK